jgi:hypothetical protein
MTVERINATWEVDLGPSSEVPGGRLVRIDGDIMVRASDYDALEARVAELEGAANEVLDYLMPTFPDSRAVDDCLVGLAAVLTKKTTSDT